MCRQPVAEGSLRSKKEVQRLLKNKKKADEEEDEDESRVFGFSDDEEEEDSNNNNNNNNNNNIANSTPAKRRKSPFEYRIFGTDQVVNLKSTKITKLLEELELIRERNPTHKSVVFSQFTMVSK